MEITIELPDEIVQQLHAHTADIPRRVLEAIALEGYRSHELTHAQVTRLLGFKNRLETDAFLKAAGVFLEYSEADLAHDLETHQRLRP